MERLRQRRREMLEQHDLGGVYDEIADELREVVETGAGRPSTTWPARRPSPATPRRQEVTDEVVQRAQHGSSTCCPPDLAGQVKALQEYEFTSSEARERFEELMDKLREQLMQRFVDQMSRRHGEHDAPRTWPG